MNDLIVFHVFTAVIGALALRGAWHASRRRGREVYGAWLMAVVWAVFWYGFDRVSVAPKLETARPICLATP